MNSRFWYIGMRNHFARRFNLRIDIAKEDEIESRIRDAVELQGATPWILIFAIFVASVGLNINSPAAIIGAMLISPLMGPIMAVGLGLALYDFDLVKRAILNLGIATVISLIISFVYFSLSPLQTPQSELVARITPTLWDVLIAFFGGMAGIIGITRKERSNVIPGVAIATALMPPICTAGYGLATGQWRFVGGAFYLYTINCVYIALAAVIGIRALKLKPHAFANQQIEKKVKFILFLLALGTSLPSVYLAINLVTEEIFKSAAQTFVAQEFRFDNTHVLATRINHHRKLIDISLIGSPLSGEILKNIESRLALSKLSDTKLIVHQSGDKEVDVMALKSSLLTDLYNESQERLKTQEDEVKKLKEELEIREKIKVITSDVIKELYAQYPDLIKVFFSEGVVIHANGESKQLLALNITSPKQLSVAEQERISAWFKVRTKNEQIVLNFETTLPTKTTKFAAKSPVKGAKI